MNLKSPIIESPNIWGYRNKCEFACGLNGQVGFYLGRNEDGTVEIVVLCAYFVLLLNFFGK
jgi:hypothetical protein